MWFCINLLNNITLVLQIKKKEKTCYIVKVITVSGLHIIYILKSNNVLANLYFMEFPIIALSLFKKKQFYIYKRL